jgi:hypothetical protein
LLPEVVKYLAAIRRVEPVSEEAWMRIVLWIDFGKMAAPEEGPAAMLQSSSDEAQT